MMESKEIVGMDLKSGFEKGRAVMVEFGTVDDSVYDLFLYDQKSNGVNRKKK